MNRSEIDEAFEVVQRTLAAVDRDPAGDLTAPEWKLMEQAAEKLVAWSRRNRRRREAGIKLARRVGR
jgi:hypothetical protein